MFTKIQTKADREEIYDQLVKQRRPVQIQIDAKTIVQGDVSGRSTSDLKVTVAHTDRMSGTHECTLTFSLPPEVYFIKTKLQARETLIDIAIDGDLYKLQRRKNFRLSIPGSVKAYADLIQVGGASYKPSLSLIDLSGGGVALELPLDQKETFKQGMRFQCQLHVGGEFQKEVHGVVRYARPIAQHPKKALHLGIEFQHQKQSDEDEIVKLVTRLYSDHFSRFRLGQ